MTTLDTTTIDAISRFWFEEVTPEQKFMRDAALDARIKEHFEPVYWQIMNGDTTAWRTTPKGRLAEIIVLDQFARNMFRDDAQAFAGDELALRLAQEARAAGDDLKVPYEQRVFFYLPYMHSESVAVHEEAMGVFTAYGDEENLEYERKHKEIIDTFGRYPHRNAALGRTSTPEEIAWLEAGGGF